jgi:Pyridoxamine 5'-phosphate oxidase
MPLSLGMPAGSTPWAEARERLEAPGRDRYWMATIQPDERPHVRPLLGLWLDDAFYFVTGETTRKGKNLSRTANGGPGGWGVGPSSGHCITEAPATRRPSLLDANLHADANDFTGGLDAGLPVDFDRGRVTNRSRGV